MALVTGTAFHLKEKIIEIENPREYSFFNLYNLLIKEFKGINLKNILKLNLIKSSKSKLYFYLVYLEDFSSVLDHPFTPMFHKDFDLSVRKEITCLIIPTGIGAKYGGYAGDANPIAKLLSYNSDYLLTHSNVVNGAVLTDPPSDLICLEGYLLDQLLLGQICIEPTKENNIGVIFDRGIKDERLDYEINVLNALRAFYGCSISAITITEKPLVIEPYISEYGFSTGTIKNLECLIEKAIKLKNLGITTIAICTSIPDLELNQFYTKGEGIDPIGGIESIISRTVSSCTGLVSANAPVLISSEKIDHKNISPVSASEYIASTFLPSVISSLRFAPRIITINDLNQALNSKPPNLKSYLNLSSVIVPYNAFGNLGVLFQNEVSKNVILVEGNKTCLNVNLGDVEANFSVVSTYKDLMNSRNLEEFGIDVSVLERPIQNITII